MLPEYHCVTVKSLTFGPVQEYQKLVTILNDNKANCEVVKKVRRYMSCMQEMQQFGPNAKVHRSTQTYKAIEHLHDCLKEIGYGDKINEQCYYEATFLTSVIAKMRT